MKKRNKIKNIEILFEDEYLLILNKPADLPIMPDHWDITKQNLKELLPILFANHLKKDEEFLFTYHLDKEISGILIIAKNDKTQSFINQQFEKHTILKTYLGLANGSLHISNGEINLPIFPSKKKHTWIDHKKGKEALTKYEVLERFRNYTYLALCPYTEHTHQLRVHLQEIGFPLAVDKMYDKGEPIYLSNIKPKYRKSVFKRGKLFEERPLLAHLALHLSQLTFIHPNGDSINISADLPKDFRITLKYLHQFQSLN